MADKHTYNIARLYSLINEKIIVTTNNIANKDQLYAKKTGTITLVDPNTNKVLGTYRFTNGGGGRGYIPDGNYVVGGEEPLASDDIAPMTVGRSGWKFRVYAPNNSELIPDERIQNHPLANDRSPRSQILIHPDGGGRGTAGCIGIVGNEEVQEDFRKNLNFLLGASEPFNGNQNRNRRVVLNFTSQTGSTVQPQSIQPKIPHPVKDQDKYKEYINRLYQDI